MISFPGRFLNNCDQVGGLVLCIIVPFILDVKLLDVPAGNTQEEGHTIFLHLPSAMLALIFIVRKIQAFF